MTRADSFADFFEVSVTCRCGRLYRPGEEAKLWACVREHVAAQRAMEKLQRQIDEQR